MLISCSTWKSFFMWRRTPADKEGYALSVFDIVDRDAVIVCGGFAESPSFVKVI